MKKVSVIIPCYNEALYIHKCLDSILCQTHQGLEIICIDDGSTDDTFKILAEYTTNDSRIQVITQKNQGISAARNAGLDLASGGYTVFVDADDWLEPHTLEMMLKYPESDIVCFSYFRNFRDRQVKKDLGLEGIFPASLIQRRIVGLVGSELRDITSFDALITCWGKLYKREVIQQVRFRDLKKFGTWEDGIFNLEVLEHAASVKVVNTPYYHYRKVPLATYTSSYKENLHLKWLYKFDWIEGFLKRHQKTPDYSVALQNRIAVTVLNLAFNEMNSGKSFSERKEVLQQILHHPVSTAALQQFRLRDVPPVWKIFYYFAMKRNAFIVTLLADLIYRLANRNTRK